VVRPANRSLQTRLVLATLLEQPAAWRHGYDLSKQTDVPSGTLYPILMRLAAQGLLEESWEPSDTPSRPLRHIDRLTASGVATARESAERDRAHARRLRLAKASR
jgi:DNA-binding PadR family transcriptional regulator